MENFLFRCKNFCISQKKFWENFNAKKMEKKMEMTIDDYFQLLCSAERPKDANEYIEFLDIYGAGYTDYLINVPNLDCSKSVKNRFFNKLVDLSECYDIEETMEALIENKAEGKIKMKCIARIFKVYSDEKILEFEEEIFDYGVKKHKEEFLKIKEKIEG